MQDYHFFKTLFLVMSWIGLSACVSTQTTDSHLMQSQLLNNDWILESLSQQTINPTSENEQSITLQINETQLKGTASCNAYFAAYQINGEMLSLTGPIGATRKLCSEAQMQSEQHYFTALAQVQTYTVENDRLILKNIKDEALLVFRRFDPYRVLQDDSWQAVAISYGNHGIVSDQNTHLSSIQFGKTELNGNAGCNNFGGSYEITGKTLKIGALRVTQMACPNAEVMQQEQQFLQALAQVKHIEIASERLQLLDATGKIKLVFVRSKP